MAITWGFVLLEGLGARNIGSEPCEVEELFSQGLGAGCGIPDKK